MVDKEKSRERQKRWIEKNPEYHKKYYKKNIEKYKSQRRKRYLANKDKEKAQHRQWCIDNRERLNAYQKQYQKDNNVKINKDNRLRRERNKKDIDNYKLSKGCSVCGYNKCAAALDFHHNGDKDFVISESLHLNINSKRFKKEMSKCILLCANCHRELHAGVKK